MSQLISDAQIEQALTVLHETVEPGAAAQAIKERAIDSLKVAQAEAFLAADGKTNAERDAQALVDPAVRACMAAKSEAIMNEAKIKNARRTAEIVVEMARTESANLRSIGRAAA